MLIVISIGDLNRGIFSPRPSSSITLGFASSRPLVGQPPPAVRLEVGEELQGEETRRAADHSAAGQGAPQRAQLRRAGQAAPRDEEAARARRSRRPHRDAPRQRRPAHALRL